MSPQKAIFKILRMAPPSKVSLPRTARASVYRSLQRLRQDSEEETEVEEVSCAVPRDVSPDSVEEYMPGLSDEI